MQIDDAYLRGERNGGKPGRGSENKQAFLIAVQTDATLAAPSFAVIKYARRYLTEAAHRFNSRFRLRNMLPRLATVVMRCKPCPEPLPRAASNFLVRVGANQAGE